MKIEKLMIYCILLELIFGCSKTDRSSNKWFTPSSNPISSTSPTITSIVPAYGQITGGTSLTITGTHFSEPMTVSLGGAECTSPTIRSTTELNCVTSASSSGGSVTVTVTNDSQESGTKASGFLYVEPLTAVSYSNTQLVFGKAASGIDPITTGTATQYSISPSLPAGLSLSATTGEVRGTPTAEQNTTTYTVTATNPLGDSVTGSFSLSAHDFGNGSTGALTVTTPGTDLNTQSTYLTANASSTDTELTVNNITPFNSAGGDLILVIQMQDSTGVGNLAWEFVTTTSPISGNKLTLSTPLVNNYKSSFGTFNTTAAQAAQVILVPQYTDLTVNSPGTITTSAWSPSAGSGGVVVLAANNSITIHAGASITTSWLGYLGGNPWNVFGGVSALGTSWQGEGWGGIGDQSTFENRGGGPGESVGGCGSAADGGNAGYATAGGNTPYLGSGGSSGTAGSSYGGVNITTATGASAVGAKIAMGAGGGGGAHSCDVCDSKHGGPGGGIIILLSNQITVNGSISANGKGHNDDPSDTLIGNCGDRGGAGAGGSIYLRSYTLTLGSNLVTAIGGPGRTTNASDGRIQLDYNTLTGTTNPTAGTTVTGVNF